IGNSFDDLKFTSKTQFVDLYLNNEYQGVYLVCEQVEVNNNRVEIEDSTDALDTGYLLELDYRAKYEGDEGEEWFYSNNIPFAIKSPEIDDDNCDFEEEDFCAFIKSYMDVCFGKLNSLNYANVQDYFDVNSFADAYILNELFKNKDVGFSSFYVYKEKSDNHLHCGPIWDYDLSSGNSATKSDNNVNYLQAKHNNIFFKKLLQYDEFNELVKNKLLEYENDIRNLIDEKTSDIVENYPMSFTRNFVKWNTIEKKQRLGSREVAKLQTWKENVKFLKKWLNESLDYMMEVYCQ
ncbi:MAG: CotH kinase family protein, partial [Clostridiales bacterium]|nr:CotH kinase family protein [Candidatus Apopatousia equi]